MLRLVHITTIAESFDFMTGQLAFMKERGFEIHGISSPGPQLDAVGEREGIPVYPVAMPRKITPLEDLRAVAQICAHLRKIQPDIVHAHTPKGGLLGMLAATIVSAPVRIYHMRGLPLVTATGAKRALLRQTEQASCRMAHHVVCVGNSLRDAAINERLCPPDKLFVLANGSGNGVDAAHRFNPALVPASARHDMRQSMGIEADDVVIGFVGRLVRDKGIIELAEAWRQLRAEFDHLHLLMAGPFEPRDPVPHTVRQALEADLRVHLMGYTRDTAAVYAAVDMVALPTYREGFPNVPLEAAAMERAIVATQIPGCTEAVQDGTTGTLVPAKDAHALAQALRSYIVDAQLRTQHGKAGRARALRLFAPERIWTDLHRTYGELYFVRQGRRDPQWNAPKPRP